jgi:hypothetical protein
MKCPSPLSCINGYCQADGGQCGTTAGTTGGTTGTGTTTTGGTTGSSVCTAQPSGLCPPNTPSDWVSGNLGCCPPSQPYFCYNQPHETALCYADPDVALADCNDAGVPCSDYSSSWCGSPSDTGSCPPNQGYCGGGNCCPLSTPWYCSSSGPGSGGCYASLTEAVASCGNSCTLCTPTCASSVPSTLCSPDLTCGTGCCVSELPFFCANSANGLCFAANAEAYQSCGSACISCQ